MSFFDSLERGEDMPLASLAVALKLHLAVLAPAISPRVLE